MPDSKGLTREEVHEALECLYDNVTIASQPLWEHFPHLQGISRLDDRAEGARALLLEAIEVLRPARPSPFGAPESRVYDVLSLRYVENQSVPEVMRELALSRRQVYRDLAEAEEKLVEVLRSWVVTEEAQPEEQVQELSNELTALASRATTLNITAIVGEAQALVHSLSERLTVRVESPAAKTGALALADAALLRQVLVQVLSGAIQSTTSGEVHIALQVVKEECRILVEFQTSAGKLKRDILEGAQALARSQDIGCSMEQSLAGGIKVTVALKRGVYHPLLVVEDNPGAVELYRRFLADSKWEIHAITDPAIAIEAARRIQPEAVILDLIMPGIDGWSIIKSLRQEDTTRDIPLIVCSVLEDPQLAESLGADIYITKPISRARLLMALRRCWKLRQSRREQN